MGEARDPALDRLDALVGVWDVEATHPKLEGVIRGTTTVEWLPGRLFLVDRSEMAPSAFPSSISVIGGGTTPGRWPMHYFDSRGVMRVYQVTADRNAIRISRDAPEFPQRLTLTSEDGGNTILVQGEVKEGGVWISDARFVRRRRAAR